MTTTQPEKRMNWRTIAQVSLLNLAVTIVILPLDSTLNRIMINELGLSASLVALLIALRFLTSPLRIWFGRYSDTHPINGRFRVPYIAVGMVIMCAGFILTPRAAFAIPDGGMGALLFAIFAFGLLGLGVNMTTPLYFAIVSDQTEEKQRSRIVAIMFIVLGVGVVISAAVIAAALDPYSNERLEIIFYVVAAIALGMSLLGLFRLEPRRDDLSTAVSKTDEGSSFKVIRKLLVENKEVGRFFIYLVLTFVAVEAQEVILEPYAAEAFNMTPAETTRLTAIFRTGLLIMLAIGAWMVNRFGAQRTAVWGIYIAAVGFGMIIASGVIINSGVFMGGVLVIGLGAGTITIANLTLMMNMTDDRNAGVYLGTWGFSQAVGVGGGTLIGGILRDLGEFVFNSSMGGYFVVYGLEIVLLIVAIPLIGAVNVGRFREITEKLTLVDAFSAAGTE